MTVSYVGTAAATVYTTTNGTNTPTLSWGTGQTRAAGDVLVLVVTAAATTSVTALTAPSGWNTAVNTGNVTSGTAKSRIGIFWKFAVGSDSVPSISVTTSGTTRCGFTLLEVNGANSVNPIDASGVFNGGSTTASISSISVSTSIPPNNVNNIGLAVYSREQATAATATWTAPSGWSAAASGSTTSTSTIGHSAVYVNSSLSPSTTAVLTEAASITSATALASAALVTFEIQETPLSTFSDNFATNDLSSVWVQSYGTFSWSTGQVNIQADTSYSSGILSSGAFSFYNNSIFCKLVPYSGASSDQGLYIQSSYGQGYGIAVTGTQLVCAVTTTPGSQTNIATPTYDPVNMAYIRLREQAGTVYFDTSPDGARWTNQTTSTTESFNLGTLFIGVYAGDYGSDPTGTTVVSNMNVQASGTLTVTPGTADEVSVTSGVASSVTSISPPAGSMVRWCVAYLNSTDTLGFTFTATDSHGTSYGAPTHTGSPGDGDGGCYLLIWDHVYSSAPGATTLTITATAGGGGSIASAAPSNALFLPYIITGQASSQSSAAFNQFSEVGTSTTTYELAITPTVLGSQVFVLGAPNHNGGATGPVTPLSNTITDVDWDNYTVGSRGTFGRASSASNALTSTTFGWTSVGASPNGYGIVVSEVIPASGGTSVSLAAPDSSTITAYTLGVTVAPPLLLASQTVTAKTFTIPRTATLQAASLAPAGHTFTIPGSPGLQAGSQTVTARTLTPVVNFALSLASSTATAYPLGTNPRTGLHLASETVTAYPFSIARTVSLLASSATQTALSPAVTIGAGANLLTASQSVTAYSLTPVYSGGASLLAAGQIQTARTPSIPSVISLLYASQVITSYPPATSHNQALSAAAQTVTAYPFTESRTVPLLTGSLTTTARNLTTIARVALPTIVNAVTAYSPTVVTPPATTVHLQTAIAATITAHPIGFIPPVFVNLLPAFVNRGALRIGPPNLPVMTMTYASGYDGFGNYIPKGFNLYGTQADQLSMSQDLYYIPQPVHGVTTNVFLPTVSFQMSQQYTTKTYNPSIMFATPNNIGFSYENTYTTINSGSVDASGGSAQSVAGINLSSEPYDGSTSAFVSFQAGNGENVAVNSDGFHVTSGSRIALTAYQQSSHTTVQPGMLAEINNQGTSNEYTSAYFSAGSSNSAAETYIYMGSASSSGATGNVIQFNMGGSVEAQITPGSLQVFGNISANNFSGSYAGGQSVTGFPIATGAGIGTANLTTGNVTIAGGFANALNSIYNALVNSGLA